MIYDRDLLLNEWQNTAKNDPLRPSRIDPDDWLRLHGLGEFANNPNVETTPDNQWTKTS